MVRSIPRGRVATYGQIAAFCGSPRGARMVGWALHVLKEDRLREIPWHRVINRQGMISTTCEEHTRELQKRVLEHEGIKVAERSSTYWIDLQKYLWQP